ncbi:MAG: hypothetical protein PVH00_00460 [Gemmatimonadota bacterium]|jgi:hypothetical protein
MFTRCLFCHSPMARNEEVEHFPVGARVAFDPGRGRLWAVCGVCNRWNLAPIEERWEALEELDRLSTDRGHLLSQTDNIALIRAGPLELVRVGRARLVEEAWWRYGREMKERRRQFRASQWVEGGAVIALALLTGGGFIMYGANGQVVNNLRRWNKFGSTAWTGSVSCPRCGSVVRGVSFRDTRALILLPGDEGFSIQLLCPRCDPIPRRRAALERPRPDMPRLEGVAAEHLLRRALAWHNFSGASEAVVRDATTVIERAGSPTDLTRSVADRPIYLQQLSGKKSVTRSIALEIALNDDTERRLLELELEELEARWREEEEIAAIADGELTPVPLLDRLRNRL